MNRNLNPTLFNPGPETEDRSMWHFTPEDDWDAERDEPVHVGTRAAAEHVGLGSDYPKAQSGSLHRLELNPRAPMVNTPDRPLSDAYANDVFGGPGVRGDEGYGETFDHGLSEIPSPGGAGAYYRNAAEDKNSISAVVTSPNENLKTTQSFRTYAPTVEVEIPGETHETTAAVRNDYPFAVNALGEERRSVYQGRLFDVPVSKRMSKAVGEPRFERYR